MRRCLVGKRRQSLNTDMNVSVLRDCMPLSIPLPVHLIIWNHQLRYGKVKAYKRTFIQTVTIERLPAIRMLPHNSYFF